MKIVAIKGRKSAASFVEHFFARDKHVHAFFTKNHDGTYETNNIQLQSCESSVRLILSKRTVYKDGSAANALTVTFTYRAYIISLRKTKYVSIDDDALKADIDGFLVSKIWGNGGNTSAIANVLREMDAWNTFQCQTTQDDARRKTSNSHRAQFSTRLKSDLQLGQGRDGAPKHKSGLGQLKTGKGDLACRCRQDENNSRTLKSLQEPSPEALFPFWYRQMTKDHLPGEDSSAGELFCVPVFVEDID